MGHIPDFRPIPTLPRARILAMISCLVFCVLYVGLFSVVYYLLSVINYLLLVVVCFCCCFFLVYVVFVFDGLSSWSFAAKQTKQPPTKETNQPPIRQTNNHDNDYDSNNKKQQQQQKTTTTTTNQPIKGRDNLINQPSKPINKAHHNQQTTQTTKQANKQTKQRIS